MVHFNSLKHRSTPADFCLLFVMRRVVVVANNQAISKKSCKVASFSFNGAACLEACLCDCKWVAHVIRELCSFCVLVAHI